VRIVGSSAGEERRQTLWQRVSTLCSALAPQPSTINSQLTTARSAILPILIGEESQAVEAAAALRERGIFIPAIRYPTVARGQARLRLTLSAAHTPADLSQLLAALKSLNLERRTSDFGL